MEQVNGQDAVFLYREQARAPLHSSTLQIFDQSSAPGGKVGFKQILAHVESRLGQFPRARQKVAFVPLNLDHPYWVEDPEFDIEFHVRHIALPEPGDWRQLCIQVARLHARPLDIGRPLWEMYVIGGLSKVDGLPEGSFAILTKIHNAAMGEARRHKDVMRPINDAILDDSPDVAAPIENARWAPERQPLPAELAMRAWINNLVQPFKIARVLSEAAPVSRLGTALRARSLGGAPKTRFNRSITPHRVMEGVAFDLKTLSEVKDVVTGATVNDVVIALIGGALRKYLSSKSEVPGETMLAVAPVTVEQRNGKTAVVDMRVPLSTHIDDALERLEAVRDAIQASGTADRAVRAQLMTDFNEYAPATTAALASRLYSNMGADLLNWITPPFNATITNVPGPQTPLYLVGARMVAKHGMGALTDGTGLNFTALSYCGELTITLTTCRAMVKDPDYFAICMEESYADLVRASADRRNRRKKQVA